MRYTNTVLLIGSLLLGIHNVAFTQALPHIEASFSTQDLTSGCRVACDVNAVLLGDTLAVVQVRKSVPGNVIRTFFESTDIWGPAWLEGPSSTVPEPCFSPGADSENCADPVFGRKVEVSRQLGVLFASAEPSAARAPIVYPYFGLDELEARGNIDLSYYTDATGPVLDIAAGGELVAISLEDGVYTFRRGLRNIFDREGEPIPTRIGVAGFGNALAMNSEWLAVGAPGRNGHVGAVYVYRLLNRFEDGTLVRFWSLQQRLQPPQDQVQAFGSALAMSDNRLIVGAPQYARDTGRAGLVYVYVLGTDERWRRHQTLADPYRPGTQGAFTERRFGTSVAVDGTRVMIGVGFGPEPFDSRPLAFLAQQRSDGQYRLTAEFDMGRSVERVQLTCATAATVGFTRLGGATKAFKLPEFARSAECASP